jgi:hypothetical protein
VALQKGEDLLAGVDRLRRRAGELNTELARIAAAPMPSAHCKRRVRETVEALAAQWARSCRVALLHLTYPSPLYGINLIPKASSGSLRSQARGRGATTSVVGGYRMSLMKDLLHRPFDQAITSKYTAMNGLIYLGLGAVLLIWPGVAQTISRDAAFVGNEAALFRIVGMNLMVIGCRCGSRPNARSGRLAASSIGRPSISLDRRDASTVALGIVADALCALRFRRMPVEYGSGADRHASVEHH